MPDRFPARTAALTALLILATIAGIGAAGPAVGWQLPARPVVVTIGCGLEVVLAGLLVALRWRAGPRSDVGARLRPFLSAALGALLIVIPAAILIGGISRLSRSRPVKPVLLRPGRGRVTARVVRVMHVTVHVSFLLDLLVALLIAAVLVTAIWLWLRYRPGLERLDALADGDQDTPAELARAVESGRQALREIDDARAAIIRCYLAMEQSLAQSGATRAAAETPDELLTRAVAGGLVHAAPASRLTALFYEARFSTHPMRWAHRVQAERALADLAATLPAGQADVQASEASR